MTDNLDWMNRHQVLLRESEWMGIATRENYKIRADLRPLFDQYPNSLELLEEFKKRKLFREGCEFMARMTHRRAAVWWGYICLLSLLEERKMFKAGNKPSLLPNELELKKVVEEAGFTFPDLSADSDIDNWDKNFPSIDVLNILETKLPPQDNSAIQAASAAMKTKIEKLDALIPNSVQSIYSESFEKTESLAVKALGKSPKAIFDEANAFAKSSPLTYKVDYANSPCVKMFLSLQEMLKNMQKEIVNQIKIAFPEKYPATPEAAQLLSLDANKRSDDAIQAVYRWIIAPDETNSLLALEAGNKVSGTAEGLLAHTAFWSFGNLTPEGNQIILVPPELPGTGLNSVLLLLALDQKGTRKMMERYELYFNLGMDVIFAKNLWTEAVLDSETPHEKVKSEEPPAIKTEPVSYQRWKYER